MLARSLHAAGVLYVNTIARNRLLNAEPRTGYTNGTMRSRRAVRHNIRRLRPLGGQRSRKGADAPGFLDYFAQAPAAGRRCSLLAALPPDCGFTGIRRGSRSAISTCLRREKVGGGRSYAAKSRVGTKLHVCVCRRTSRPLLLVISFEHSTSIPPRRFAALYQTLGSSGHRRITHLHTCP